MLLYIIGVVLSVIAVLDIVKKPIGLIGKIISFIYNIGLELSYRVS